MNINRLPYIANMSAVAIQASVLHSNSHSIYYAISVFLEHIPVEKYIQSSRPHQFFV
jgi:hypothetical protein